MTCMSKRTKQLWLIRHAHAELIQDGQLDSSRSLTPKGHQYAHLLGAWLAEQNLSKALLLVSSANRSQETGAEIQAAFSAPIPEQTEAIIYDAQSSHEIRTLLSQVSDYYEHVLLVGHNPLLKELLAELLDLPFMGPFHKAAIAQLDTQATSWEALKSADFIQYWTPKKATKCWQFQVHLGLSEVLKRMGGRETQLIEQESLRELGDELALNIQEIQNQGEQTDIIS